MTGEERASPERPSTTVVLSEYAVAKDMTDPRDYVRIVPRQIPHTCMMGTGVDYVVNSHPRETIRVTVRTRWIYNNRLYESYEDHLVGAGGESEIGCVIPGPTMQRFDHDIVGAIFN